MLLPINLAKPLNVILLVSCGISHPSEVNVFWKKKLSKGIKLQLFKTGFGLRCTYPVQGHLHTSVISPVYEVYRGCIVFVFSVNMFV